MTRGPGRAVFRITAQNLRDPLTEVELSRSQRGTPAGWTHDVALK